MTNRVLALLLPSLAVLSSCGGGTPAEAIRPKDATYSGAMGEAGGSGGGASCHEIEAYGEPLVVDWKPEQRGDLEVVMKEGVAIASYSCKGLKVLKDCKVDGKYGFLGMTKKEQLVRLQNEDELKANLPLAGAGIAANIGAEMQRGASLDVALVMIGKKKTTWAKVAAEDLKGDCNGATHFVRGATIGAFVMETGSKAQARTAAQIFGAGASGGSASAKNVRNQDGDPGDCAKSSPDADKPPSQCQAMIRLELKAITPKAAGAAGDAAKPPPEPPKPQPIEAVEEPCPKDLVYADGKCTAPKAAPSHLCDPVRGTECVEQCGKGNMPSCGSAGSLLATGGGGLSRDETKARELLGKACDAGEVKGCVALGVLQKEGRGGAKDASAAVKSFEKGCKDADATGCHLLGIAYRTGDGAAKDDAKAAAAFRQACDGGNDHACGALGRMTLDGQGVSRDVGKAADLLKRACDGSVASACNELGVMIESGKEIQPDPIRAKMLYQRGCVRGDAVACANQGRAELGFGGNQDAAKRAFEFACTFKQHAISCAALKIVFNDASRTVFPNPSETNDLTAKCNAGSARDCASSGILSIAQGNKPAGMAQIERACIQRDPLACAVKNKK
jgi:TPR repeat protein